jgi:hypothetical protein
LYCLCLRLWTGPFPLDFLTKTLRFCFLTWMSYAP